MHSTPYIIVLGKRVVQLILSLLQRANAPECFNDLGYLLATYSRQNGAYRRYQTIISWLIRTTLPPHATS